MKVLVKYGSDVNVRDGVNKMIFCLVVSEGYIDIVVLLLENGVDVNLVDGEGYILFYNLYSNFYNFFSNDRIFYVIVEFLFKYGSRIDERDFKGWIEFYMVCECLLVKFVEYLF